MEIPQCHDLIPNMGGGVEGLPDMVSKLGMSRSSMTVHSLRYILHPCTRLNVLEVTHLSSSIRKSVQDLKENLRNSST